MTLLRRLLLLLGVCTALEAAPPPTGTTLDGATASPWADSAARAIALVFVAPDCPISNRYAPTLARLAADCAERSIAVWLVYSDDQADPARIRENQAEFGLTGIATLIDRDFTMADFAGADVTPEAAVFVRPSPESAPRLVYRGRIDDQYEGYNTFRPAATTSELRATLDRIAAGEVPEFVRTKAIGCYIPRP